MRRPTRAVLAVSGAVLGAAVLAGCAAPGTGTAYKASVSSDAMSPADAVRAATAATAKSGSASVRLTVTADTGSTPTTAEVRGKLALDGSAADLTATLPGDSGPLTVQQRLVDGVIYLRVDGSDVLPATWVKLDPSALPEGAGADLGGALGGAGSDTVTAPLDALREVADVTKVGSEDLDGIATTHYRATIDPAKIAGAFGPLASLGGGKLAGGGAPVDLWVDGDDHVVRMTQTLGSGSGSVAWTLDLRDLGAPMKVAAPSGAVDVGSLLGSLGGLLGGDGGAGLDGLSGLLGGLLGDGATTTTS